MAEAETGGVHIAGPPANLCGEQGKAMIPAYKITISAHDENGQEAAKRGVIASGEPGSLEH